MICAFCGKFVKYRYSLQFTSSSIFAENVNYYNGKVVVNTVKNKLASKRQQYNLNSKRLRISLNLNVLVEMLLNRIFGQVGNIFG
jgi:hypothetical protein